MNKDKFQILRDFANSNDKPDRTIYQFIKEVIEENKILTEEMKDYQQWYHEEKQKNRKASEFIKDNACYDGKECKCSFSSMTLDKVLEILGDSNE